MSDITHAGRRPMRADLCSRERVQSTASIAQRQMNDAVWWSQTGSNRRPPACKAGALPTELWPLASGVLMSELPACGAVARGNQHRPASSPPALTLQRGSFASLRERRLVGLGRFELPTSRLSSARSNQLSYKPEPDASDQRSIIRQTRSSDYRLLITDR
jgi:hypothetical protein